MDQMDLVLSTPPPCFSVQGVPNQNSVRNTFLIVRILKKVQPAIQRHANGMQIGPKRLKGGVQISKFVQAQVPNPISAPQVGNVT